MKTKGADTKVVDLGGKTLMPSFIDSHGHFMNAPQLVKWAMQAPRLCGTAASDNAISRHG